MGKLGVHVKYPPSELIATKGDDLEQRWAVRALTLGAQPPLREAPLLFQLLLRRIWREDMKITVGLFQRLELEIGDNVGVDQRPRRQAEAADILAQVR